MSGTIREQSESCESASSRERELPKSLQGTEDADLVWDMITERFPNAAPLLCEMETVIDRAEDLLRQLKAPCHREIDVSTSFYTLDSEDSISLIPTQESLVNDDDTVEAEKCVAEAQVSVPSFSESDSLGSTREDTGSLKSADQLVETTEKETKGIDSLEKWEQIVNTAMRSSTDTLQNKLATTGDSINTEESNQPSRHTKLTEMDEIPKASSQSIDKEKDTGDENTVKRTPLAILESYAKRCNVPVVYEFITDGPQRHKSHVFVIRGDLAGFTAMSRGVTEDLAKNSLARTILLLVAEQQMNDKKLPMLLDLTRKELLEILELDSEKRKDTGLVRLYKLCLERGEEIPRYTVERSRTYQGSVYVATCTALGYTAQGHGVRDVVAKNVAADELYGRYRQDVESRLPA